MFVFVFVFVCCKWLLNAGGGSLMSLRKVDVCVCFGVYVPFCGFWCLFVVARADLYS